MNSPGCFVAIEGGDGSGKTTHIPLLVQWLHSATEREVLTTREPGGTELGTALRELLLYGGDVDARAEALLYAADRAQHVAEVIEPALERGAIVVADRYVDSSIAYQVEGRGLGLADVVGINAFATGGLTPDLTCLLDVDPAVAAARRDRAADRMEREAQDFHIRVRRRYVALADAAPHRYCVVDTGGPIEAAHLALCAAVAKVLGIAAP